MSVATRPPLVLVDGSSYLFRAYYALPPLTTQEGLPTGAIYGVINMLRQLVSTYPSSKIAVVFDTKGPNFRHDLYPAYKANRTEMPEDLSVQIEPLHDVIEAMGLPLLAIEGVEADDVIGTLAVMADAQQIPVIISTGDKDFAQLVNEGITLENTMNSTLLGPKEVEEKFGVAPNRIVDYLTLVGDTVDNIPGVPKVGPKTAAKWLASYGSLDNLLAHVDEVKGKVGDSLREFIPQIPLTRTLVTIKTDVLLPFGLEALSRTPSNIEHLKELFERLAFKTWLKTLNSREAAMQEDVVPGPAIEHEVILTQSAFEEMLSRIELASVVGFDTETTSLSYLDAELVGLSFSVEDGKAYYVPVGHSYEGAPEQLPRSWVLDKLKPAFRGAPKFVGHHLKYDCHVLLNQGVELSAVLGDTMLMSYVLNSVERHDLASVAQRYLGASSTSYEAVTKIDGVQVTFDKVPLETAAPYAAEDAALCWQLYQKLHPKLTQEPKLLYVYESLDLSLVPVLLGMERLGVLVCEKKLAEQSQRLGEELQKLEVLIYGLAGMEFNIGSPKQMQEVLFDHLKLPVIEKTPTGQPSTAESVLSVLAQSYELPKHILQYRSLQKLKSTYTDKLPLQIHPQTGRIHTSYHQAVTATGRLSSTDPNLQNIPIKTEEGKLVRQAFVPAAGFLMMSADYSQVELRIMAHLSGDVNLRQAFERGEDVHRFTASEIFECSLEEVSPDQRRYAKAINFGLIYGMSAFGLARQLGIQREDAQTYIDLYFSRYPGVRHFMESIKQTGAAQGYVETIQGRRLYLPDLKSGRPNKRKAAERVAINAPMQGTAADIMKLAMIKMHALIQASEGRLRMIMQVHDELVFEVAPEYVEEAKALVKTTLESVGELSVPLTVDVGVGANWDEAH